MLDAIKNLSKPKIQEDEEDNLIFAWKINDWKREYIDNIFHQNKVYYFPFKLTEKGFDKKYKEHILKNKNSKILIWGLEYPEYLKKFIERYKIETIFMEDGFIRSVGLGSTHELPYSVVMDKKTLYFDSREESQLEYILKNYNFNEDSQLMNRAMNLKKKLLNSGISKYNNTSSVDIEAIYGKKTKKRILVIGQVEDDASIKFGCDKKITNNELVYRAYLENPEAQIIYKPHPDVLIGKRKMLSDPKEVEHISLVLKDDFPISQAFDTIDHVYTITSLSGFEALLRNIKVTTLGMPFYSGWGLTDDRQLNTRRNRKLDIDELFAGAYILYPTYFDPVLKEELTAEEAIDRLILLKQANLNNSSYLEDGNDEDIIVRYLDNIKMDIQCLYNNISYNNRYDDITSVKLRNGRIEELKISFDDDTYSTELNISEKIQI